MKTPELKPCPFCGYKNVSLRYHQAKYYGTNGYGAKKIKFTGYIVCNKCLARSKPVSVTKDNVECYGWSAGLRTEMLPLAAEEWNRRVTDV